MIKKCKRCKYKFVAKLNSAVYCNRGDSCISRKEEKERRAKKPRSVAVKAPRVPRLPRPDHERDKHYRDKYNITLDDFNKMSATQDNRCGICGSIGSLYVDHDHATGDVRGLLCPSCNTGLGQFKDSVGALRAAIAYLTKPST